MKERLEEGLCSFSLYTVSFEVSDLADSINWYQNIFDFKLIRRNAFKISCGWAEVAIIERAGVRLELTNETGEKLIQPDLEDSSLYRELRVRKMIVLQVNDIAFAAIELENKGIAFEWCEQLIEQGVVLCISIKDPDGNKVNIFQSNTILKVQDKF